MVLHLIAFFLGVLDFRSIQDFRIGRVKIPALFISKFSEGNRTLKGIYLTKLEIQGDSLYLERR